MTASKKPGAFPNLLLLTAVLGLLAIELSGWGVQGLLHRRTQLMTTQQQLLDAQLAQRQVREQQNALQELTKRSLSSNPSRAVSTYQQTLLSRSQAIGIRKLTIDPGKPKKIAGVGYETTCTIRGGMTAVQFARLLDEISRLDTLHRVTGIQLLPVARKAGESGNRQVTLTSQVVTLLDATDKTAIPIRKTSSSFASVLSAHPILTRYEPKVVASKPREVSPPVETKFVATVTETPPPVNHLRKLQFVAAFARDNEWKAWLYNPDLRQHYAVSTDDTVSSGSHSLRIGAIGSDYLVVATDDTQQRIDLGECLSK